MVSMAECGRGVRNAKCCSDLLNLSACERLMHPDAPGKLVSNSLSLVSGES